MQVSVLALRNLMGMMNVFNHTTHSSVDKGIGFAVYNVCYHPKALTWTSPIIMKELDEECLVVHNIESPHGAVS